MGFQDYETLNFPPDDDFDAETFLEGLQEFKFDLQLSTIGFHQPPEDSTRTNATYSASPSSACISGSQSSANAQQDNSSHRYGSDSQSRTTASTADSLDCQSPRPPIAAIEHESPVTCQYCARLFAPQSLRRHLVSRHSFTCEKGCEHQAFETRRDLERHYKTSLHREHDRSGGTPKSGAADYECACGKPDFRKDLHKRHLLKCKKTGRGTFHCRLCDHHVTSRELHEAHLATCLRKRGRRRK
ncbi:hypothetical protein PG995_009241 [Apiospora arundinis]